MSWYPKNVIDQRMLIINWAENMARGIFILLFWLSFNTMYREIPIRVYRVSQTGPNSQSGGVKKGLSRLAYHDVIDGMVNSEPMTPAN
ncbi:hypothetical protein A3K64_02950 [Candidatus Micrarchaeota archaeon RBG_16_36_9]|nr:MAG: hypothetical protein A3K64_02950 [Candidatus Micrarchaeota archaeon RBG_16_36_9]